MKYKLNYGWQLALFVVSAVVSQAPQAMALDFAVSDEASLNAAITQINAAGPGSHTIMFEANIFLSGSTTPLNNPASGEQIIIYGMGFTIDATQSGRCFNIESGTTVRIEDLTITGGRVNGSYGAGILNKGDLSLNRCMVVGNNASSSNHSGGGIHSSGILYISDSTIANNNNTVNIAYGGGISCTGEATIRNSTISGNRAIWHGGGIYLAGSANVVLDQVTVSGNTMYNINFGDGGGVYVSGSANLTLNYCTITNNTATRYGGGIRLAGGSVTLNSTIVAGNNAPDECSGTGFIDTGYNIGGDASCNLTQPTSHSETDPMLGPLAYNGGATQTHMPQSESPAVDKIPAAINGCGTIFEHDQTSSGRPQLDTCDIGAVEIPGDYVGMALDDQYDFIQTTNMSVPAPGVLTNDLHGASTATLVDDVDHGTLTLNPDGSFTYETANTFIGTDSFTYTAAGPEFSDTATVTIEVLPANCAIETTGDNVTDYVSPDAQALRDAIADAAPGAVLLMSGTCGGVSGGEVITIDKQITIQGGFDHLNWQSGPDPAAHPSVINAENGGRGVVITASGNAALSDITITGASMSGASGSGVLNYGSLSLIRCRVVGNRATGSNDDGNGIYSTGILDISDSTIANNTGFIASGGGIYASGETMIRNSTISGNQAIWYGAGLRLNGSSNIFLDQVTISGNHLYNVNYGYGGGIYINGSPNVFVNFCTITNNTASRSGGSIHINGGSVTLNSTILAGNSTPSECAGTGITDAGYNIADDATCNLTEATSLPETDPMLEPLADNGGLTLTHGLGCDSPAFNLVPYDANGCGTTFTVDQVGTPRPQTDSCECGAFELEGQDTDTDEDGILDLCDPCAGGAASGDTDANGAIDLDDYSDFSACFQGPTGGLGEGCECFDFDADNDNDLQDFAAFQAVFTGN